MLAAIITLFTAQQKLATTAQPLLEHPAQILRVRSYRTRTDGQLEWTIDGLSYSNVFSISPSVIAYLRTLGTYTVH